MQEEDYPVQVQKTGGPFRVYYNYVPSSDDLPETERSEFGTSFYVSVLKGEEGVAGFDCDDVDQAYGCMLQAEAYIANQLRENYPEYLVPEAAAALNRNDVIPVGLVRTITAEQMDYFNSKTSDQDMKTLNRLSDDEIKANIIRKAYEKDFNRISDMEKVIRQRKTALTEMSIDHFLEAAPKWYELRKQYRQMTQTLAIANETKRIERMEEKCQEQQKALWTQGSNNKLVQEETRVLMDKLTFYRKLVVHIKTVGALNNKMNQLPDTTLVPFSTKTESQKINSAALLKAVEKHCTHKIVTSTLTKDTPSKSRNMGISMSM